LELSTIFLKISPNFVVGAAPELSSGNSLCMRKKKLI